MTLKHKVKLFVAIAVATIVLNTTGDLKQAEHVYITVLNWGKRKKATVVSK